MPEVTINISPTTISALASAVRALYEKRRFTDAIELDNLARYMQTEYDKSKGLKYMPAWDELPSLVKSLMEIEVRSHPLLKS